MMPRAVGARLTSRNSRSAQSRIASHMRHSLAESSVGQERAWPFSPYRMVVCPKANLTTTRFRLSCPVFHFVTLAKRGIKEDLRRKRLIQNEKPRKCVVGSAFGFS